MNIGWIADKGKNISLSHSNPRGHPGVRPSSYLLCTVVPSPGDKVVFQLNSVPRLRMQGSKAPLTHMPLRPAQNINVTFIRVVLLVNV
jgi:hypothetical protein